MPFTLSHAAAVLPAVRTDGTGRGRLVPAVLVAGSFSPDMTYYAASVVSGAMEFGTVTHSFPGVFTVDVLVAWALVGLWLLLREPLVALLPRGRQGGVATLLRCGAPRARVTAALAVRWYVSAALGALTHVVWDAFTHLDRWGMRLFPVLGREVAGLAAVLVPAVRRFGAGRGGDRRVLRVRAAPGTRGGRAAGRPCAVGAGPVVGRGRDRRVRDGGRVAAGLAVVGVLGLHREAAGS